MDPLLVVVVPVVSAVVAAAVSVVVKSFAVAVEPWVEVSVDFAADKSSLPPDAGPASPAVDGSASDSQSWDDLLVSC